MIYHNHDLRNMYMILLYLLLLNWVIGPYKIYGFLITWTGDSEINKSQKVKTDQMHKTTQSIEFHNKNLDKTANNQNLNTNWAIVNQVLNHPNNFIEQLRFMFNPDFYQYIKSCCNREVMRPMGGGHLTGPCCNQLIKSNEFIKLTWPLVQKV